MYKVLLGLLLLTGVSYADEFTVQSSSKDCSAWAYVDDYYVRRCTYSFDPVIIDEQKTDEDFALEIADVQDDITKLNQALQEAQDKLKDLNKDNGDASSSASSSGVAVE